MKFGFPPSFHKSIALAVLAALLVSGSLLGQPVNPETEAAPGYSAPPPTLTLGGASVAAYSPPHEQLEDPASDTNTINNNRTFETLTRPIYLTSELLNASGDPLKPVATTDWWTNVLMAGDGGQLWQYPTTAKFVASGIELQQIVGPAIPSTPGDIATGFATGGLLRIEGVEVVAQTATPDIVLADFEGSTNLPASWIGSGSFSPSNPSVIQFIAPAGSTPTYQGTPPSGFSGVNFLLTKNPAESGTGTLTSVTSRKSLEDFEISAMIGDHGTSLRSSGPQRTPKAGA